MHNVGTVPTSKMHNVGTVPTYKMYNIGTVPMFKLDNIGTKVFYDSFLFQLGLYGKNNGSKKGITRHEFCSQNHVPNVNFAPKNTFFLIRL